ncbi:RteC domain-containing protein [uncultured Flavobacterium sp.]|uniref:RteC domain-containing protein n=1 Tax=uncultured Flavobacterium sp. TaxID=165435 RepID=UPI0030C82566
MKNFSEGLLASLEKQLEIIYKVDDKPIVRAKKAIKATINTFEELKTFVLKYGFKSKEEEIEFFKKIKPKVASKLIYYNEIYNIEINKPSGSNKAIKKYYTKEQTKLKDFYYSNKEFYKYYRSGSNSLDKKYFLRRKHDIRLTLDSFYFQSDYSFATSHDYKVAQIVAHQALEEYLESKLKKHQIQNSTKPKQAHLSSPLQWTGSKVALVELMYALHTEGVLNNGNLSLNETAKNMEVVFNIEIGQFNRIFSEIKKRKTIEPTSFLNNLKQNLTKKIQEADEK